jgi:hypothetical protein
MRSVLNFFFNSKFLGSSKRLHSSPFLKMESSGFDDNIKRFTKIERHSVIEDYVQGESRQKRVIYCPKCCEEMEILFYVRKPLSKDMSKITSWIG